MEFLRSRSKRENGNDEGKERDREGRDNRESRSVRKEGRRLNKESRKNSKELSRSGSKGERGERGERGRTRRQDREAAQAPADGPSLAHQSSREARDPIADPAPVRAHEDSRDRERERDRDRERERKSSRGGLDVPSADPREEASERDDGPLISDTPTMSGGSIRPGGRSRTSGGVTDAITDSEVYTGSRLYVPKNEKLLTARKYFRQAGMKTSDFEWYETVGKGTFGNVKMVALTQTAMQRIYSQGCPQLPRLAIKTMKKKNIIMMDQVEHIKAEVETLSSLDHPFIIGLYGVMQDATRLYLLMEYIRGGELFSLLANYNNFGYDQTKFYAAQVTLAFEYLHDRKIAYRDLKPENLLLDQHGNIKVADFGFAKEMVQRSWTICGTPEYIAPEVLMSKGHGCGVDWWGLGVLIFEMITGQPPFVHDNTMVLYRMIQDVQIKYPRTMDIRTKDLVRRLLVKDLTRRYGCLKGGADDIKRHKFFRGINWQDCISRRIPAPWKPDIVSGDPANKYFDSYAESVEMPEPITSEEQRKYFNWFDMW